MARPLFQSTMHSNTELALPYPALAAEIAALLADTSVYVPPRIVAPLHGGGSLFVMPGSDTQVAMTKVISFTPGNVGTARPTIQGDVLVLDVATGERRLLLDGPTVTARRTAAVSLLAAQRLAPNPDGPVLIVGAGVQGKAHLDAFATGLGSRRFRIASRSTSSAEQLAAHARQHGLEAEVVTDPDAALQDCPLVVTCTPASQAVLHATPRVDAFVAAVGAFTPAMVELSPEFCRHFAEQGRIVVDTPEAEHEAGDLLQAGLEVVGMPTLTDVVLQGTATQKDLPVLFKSCGWAGWDLAAARLAMRVAATA